MRIKSSTKASTRLLVMVLVLSISLLFSGTVGAMSLQVVSTNPGANATDVAVNIAEITITYDKSIREKDFSKVFLLDGTDPFNEIAHPVICSIGVNQLVIAPQGFLNPDTFYRVRVLDGAVEFDSLFGWLENPAYSFNFTTGAAPVGPVKDGLADLLDEANDLKDDTPVGDCEGEAPQAAHDALQDAIAAAQAVFDDDDATQQEIDEAADALQEAMDTFEDAVIVINREALDARIAAAQALKDEYDEGDCEGQVPAAAHAALAAAIAAAQDMFDNPCATQDEVNAAVDDLQDAMDAFAAAVIVIDRDALAARIAAAQALKDEYDEGDCEGEVPAAAHAALAAAIAAAQDVHDDDCATQDEVNAAVDDLQDAMDDFADAVIVINREALGDLLGAANDLQDGTPAGDCEGEAPAAAHDALQDAIAAAQAVFDDPCATQQEVDDAADALQDAMDAFAAAVIVIDRDALGDLLDEANQLKDDTEVGEGAGQAPQAAHDALQDAIDAAQAVFDDPCATQQEVDDAADALQDAMDAFAEAIVTTFTLTLEADPEDGGTLTGDGDYEIGEMVPVEAVAYEGAEPYDRYLFLNWTRNGLVVSTAAGFVFAMPAEEVTLVAHFLKRGDVNNDGVIDIFDVILAIRIALGQDLPPLDPPLTYDQQFWAADVSGDGAVNIVDVYGISNLASMP